MRSLRWAPHLALALVVLFAIGLVSYAVTMAQTGASLLPLLQRGSTVAVANYASRTTAITTTNLGPRSNGRVDAPGFYALRYYMQVILTGTSTDMAATFGWTDSTTARTLTSSTLSCATKGFTQGIEQIWVADTANAVTYSTALTGTCSYSLGVVLERLY